MASKSRFRAWFSWVGGLLLLGCVPSLDHMPCTVDDNCPEVRPYCKGGFCSGTPPSPILEGSDGGEGGDTGDASTPDAGTELCIPAGCDGGTIDGGALEACSSGVICVSEDGGSAGGSTALAITKPQSDGVCGSSCAGAIIRAADLQMEFSGMVNDGAGLSGMLVVSVTRGGASVVTDSVRPLGGAWSWTWDTSGLSDDGTMYTFSISATDALGKQVIASRGVWVDRTPPSPIAFLPIHGATGVWPLDPVKVTFSEPLSPQSVSDLSATIHSDAEPVVAKRLSLSSDGRTLSIKLLTPPLVGEQLELSFGAGVWAFEDRVGNTLVVPSAPWRWSVVPIWVDLAPIGLSISPRVSSTLLGPEILLRGLRGDRQLESDVIEGGRWPPRQRSESVSS